MKQGKKSELFGFGKGWGTIIFCLLMFWFYAGMVNDSSNIVAPAVAEKLGIPAGSVLNMGTVAAMIGVIFFFVMGALNRKIGARATSFICLILAGAGYFGMGHANSLFVYAFSLCVCTIGAMSAGYIAGGALVAQWFPKKKGIVMGYTTMGHNLASAFYVPMITVLVNQLGVRVAVIIPAAAVIVLSILGIIFVRNTPQEVGINPDNVSDETYKADYADTADPENDDGGWTTKKLLTNKELWLAGITTGFFQICSVGVMSQLVVRNQQLGFSQSTAVAIMTVLACIGIFGSFIIGVFDDKFGTKKTMIFFGVWYIVALLCNVSETTFGIYISIFMIGMAIGGSANFTTSLPASIFGRQGFAKVNSVLFPIQGLFTSLCFAVNGIVLNLTGSLRYAYIVFACVAAVNIVLVCLVNEHKYNKDYEKELQVRARTEAKIREIERRVREELEKEEREKASAQA